MTEYINSIDRKASMYEMLLAIENDFIDNFSNKLDVSKIPDKVQEHSNASNSKDKVLSILQGIDFQSYVEICNSNLLDLGLGQKEKEFLNKELVKIIPVRNNVMHPRPLGYMDYYIVKGIFDQIDEIIPQFSWINVLHARKKIKEHPETLKLPPENVKKSNRIIENIPVTADFEETSFIGRKKEIGELKAKIQKNNVHILSIIGDGGIGKTALAIKLLYDLLDDEKCKFELILWVSLKTNELNNYEFKNIKNAIDSTSEMYSALGKFVGVNEEQDTKEYLIELAKEFNMLLVLDNLETINTEDIKEFLDSYTEYGKVLITSRIGLGEMEYRYRLEGLDDEDVKTYMDTLLELYGFEGILTDSQRMDIAIKHLHSNPLAIKWFVRCLYNGESVDAILNNKSELATFCMSNVFEKLSNNSHRVLDVLSIANREISIAELIFYLNSDGDDIKDVSYAINELVKCNFIDNALFKTQEKVSITDFAKEFLLLKGGITSELIDTYRKKERSLQNFAQQQLIATNERPYFLKTFHVTNKEPDRLVAAYLLNEAVELQENGDSTAALLKVNLAKKISKDYYQCNRIAAYIYSKTSIENGKKEYEIALECCNSNDDLVNIYIGYAGFLLRCDDYISSIEYLEKADELEKGNNCYVKFELAKENACIAKYDVAKEIINNINIDTLDSKQKNIYFTRLADIKKRESRKYDQRDYDKKLELIIEAFHDLEKSENPDTGIYNYMVVLLDTLSYMAYSEPAMLFLCKALDKYYYDLRKQNNYKKFREKLSKKTEQIKSDELRSRIENYIKDYNLEIERLSVKEGIVYSIGANRKYGFFKNSKHPNGVYFKITPDIKAIQVGDIVKYEKVLYAQQGQMVDSLKIIKTNV